MAKVKMPLMSASASGKIANSLVYFTWKGLDVVRSYVVPSNPNTTSQQTQRVTFQMQLIYFMIQNFKILTGQL